MRRILIIVGHPDPDPGRLCRALAHAYAEGAASAGHRVEQIDLALLDVPLLRTRNEFAGPVPPGLADAARAIVEAEHIVLVFPLWLGTMPALLKAFLEQVMRPGVAFEYPQDKGGGFAKTLRKGRSARVVVTMGMPAFIYNWYFGAHSVKSLKRNILNFVGISPVRSSIVGMVEGSAESRAEWLETMRTLGRKAQ